MLTVVATGSGTLTYQWYQGTSGSGTPIGGATSSSYTTPALTSTTNYWVRVSNGAGTADSNTATIAVYAPFTNDTLFSGLSVIRAVHITELRTRIDALRDHYGLGTFAWTDASLDGIAARALHVTELNAALAGAYVAAGRSAPTYTDPNILSGSTQIKAVHIQELRNRVIDLEVG